MDFDENMIGYYNVGNQYVIFKICDGDIIAQTTNDIDKLRHLDDFDIIYNDGYFNYIYENCQINKRIIRYYGRYFIDDIEGSRLIELNLKFINKL